MPSPGAYLIDIVGKDQNLKKDQLVFCEKAENEDLHYIDIIKTIALYENNTTKNGENKEFIL